MNILINGITYQLTNDQQRVLTSLFHGKIEDEYKKLEPTGRLAAKAIARGALEWIENRVKAEAGIEAAKRVRPEKKADPVPHLLTLGERLLGDMMAHVTISFSTIESRIPSVDGSCYIDGPGTIENFEVRLTPKGQSKNGGQVDLNGHVGIRQDNGPEVSGLTLYETVPTGPPLYPGFKA